MALNKYKVYGRIRADINFEEIVEAVNEENAVVMAEQRIYAKTGIGDMDVLDDEIYCDLEEK